MNINQKVELHSLFKSISVLSFKHLFARMDKTRLHPGQHIIMENIVEHEGISQRELANLTLKEPATITTMIQKMELQDYVRRVPDAIDKRIIRLYITPKGQEMYKQSKQAIKAVAEISFQNLTSKELEDLKNILEKIKKNLEAKGREGNSICGD